jgi:hypothetical protein
VVIVFTVLPPTALLLLQTQQLRLLICWLWVAAVREALATPSPAELLGLLAAVPVAACAIQLIKRPLQAPYMA